MIKSMTGFGIASSKECNLGQFTIELKSVNNRYLDINIRMPKFMISLEESIRKIVSSRLGRGKVDVFINYKEYENTNLMPRVDINLAKKYYECLIKLEKELNIRNDITVSKISNFSDVIVLDSEEKDLEEILVEVTCLMNEALDFMIEMREKEGQKLKEDILGKIEFIENQVKDIEKIAPTVPINYKKKLEERIAELTSIDIDEQRIALEVAIFADKAAIDEEIIRLYSHINQMRATLELNEPIGRKLDFIIQEINRETNTIGSKANEMNITNKVIDIKNCIEKIREQVQNIE